MAVGSSEGFVTLLNNSLIKHDIQAHRDDIRSIFSHSATSPGSSSYFLAGSYDHSASLWGQSDSFSEWNNRYKLSMGHTDKILDVTSLGSSDILTSGADGRAILWMKN